MGLTFPCHLNIPAINESKPKTNKTRTAFFIRLAFVLEGFLSNDKEHPIKPISVTKTKGTNHRDTKPKTIGTGDKQTAKIKKKAAERAARLSPNITARVRML